MRLGWYWDASERFPKDTIDPVVFRERLIEHGEIGGKKFCGA